jgi:hypothetical protein
MQETQLIDIHVNTRVPKHWIRTKQDSILAFAKRAVARLWLRVRDQRREWQAVLPITFPVIHAMPLSLENIALILQSLNLRLAPAFAMGIFIAATGPRRPLIAANDGFHLVFFSIFGPINSLVPYLRGSGA